MAILSLEHAQLAMPAGQEDQARAVYVDGLRLAEIPKPSARAARGGGWFESGPAKIHLGVESDFRPARQAPVALLVDDLDELLARAQAAGCTFEATDGLGRSRHA